MWGTLQGMVYLGTGHHDRRKSINGLALVATETLGHDPVGSRWVPSLGTQLLR
jgi:transposase